MAYTSNNSYSTLQGSSNCADLVRERQQIAIQNCLNAGDDAWHQNNCLDNVNTQALIAITNCKGNSIGSAGPGSQNYQGEIISGLPFVNPKKVSGLDKFNMETYLPNRNINPSTLETMQTMAGIEDIVKATTGVTIPEGINPQDVLTQEQLLKLATGGNTNTQNPNANETLVNPPTPPAENNNTLYYGIAGTVGIAAIIYFMFNKGK